MKDIQIKRTSLGVFNAVVDGVQSDFYIRIDSGFGGGQGSQHYSIFKKGENKRYNPPIVKLNIHKAKKFLIKLLETN